MELNLAEENRIEWHSVDLLSPSSVQVIRSLINHCWIIRSGSLKSIDSVEKSKGKTTNRKIRKKLEPKDRNTVAQLQGHC